MSAVRRVGIHLRGFGACEGMVREMIGHATDNESLHEAKGVLFERPT